MQSAYESTSLGYTGGSFGHLEDFVAFWPSRLFGLKASSDLSTSATYYSSYDPFDNRLIGILNVLPPFLIAAYVLRQLYARYGPRIELKYLVACINTLSPFITEEDLKIGRGIDSEAFLRRGAVHEVDEDDQQYSMEGFRRQRRRNATICLLSFFKIIAWTFASGWSIAYYPLPWRIQSEPISSISSLTTWVS